MQNYEKNLTHHLAQKPWCKTQRKRCHNNWHRRCRNDGTKYGEKDVVIVSIKLAQKIGAKYSTKVTIQNMV